MLASLQSMIDLERGDLEMELMKGGTRDLLRIAAVSHDPRILALTGGVARRGIIRRPVPMIHYVSAVKSLVTSQPNVPNTWDAK